MGFLLMGIEKGKRNKGKERKKQKMEILSLNFPNLIVYIENVLAIQSPTSIQNIILCSNLDNYFFLIFVEHFFLSLFFLFVFGSATFFFIYYSL